MPSTSSTKSHPSGENSLKYLDASIPLCVETETPYDKLSGCENIMKRIEEGEEKVLTTAYTPAEIFHILRRENVPARKVKESFEAFFDLKGLKVVEAKGSLCPQAIELALEKEIDFIDAHHVLTMKDREIGSIYTLDPHFEKFPQLVKLEKYKK